MFGPETNCPACGSSDTTATHEFTNDSLESLELVCQCNNCHISGSATMTVSDINWDYEEDEEEED